MFNLARLGEELNWQVYLGQEGYKVKAYTAAQALRVALFDFLDGEHWSERDRGWWLMLDSADILDTLPDSLEVIVILEDADEGETEGRVLN